MSSWSTRSRWFGLALVLALGTSGSAKAQNAVLELGGIGGAALAKPEPIDILSFSWGASQIVTFNMKPMDLTAATPPPDARTVRILKRVDKSTPLIAQALARNERFPEATLTVPKGGSSQEYLKITLKNVFISSYQTGGSQDRPTESLTLNFTAIEFNYAEKKPAAPPGPAKAGYDLEKVQAEGAGGREDPPAAGLAAAAADLLPFNGLTLATSFIPWGQTATISTDAASSRQGGRCFFRYRYDTGNQGPVAAGATTNRIHLDAANGPSLADDPLPALAASDQKTSSGLLPLVVGTWTLYVHVDDDLLVAEDDEQNNLRRVRVRVEGSCEDEAETGEAPSSPTMQNDALSATRFAITVDGYEIASFSELAGISTSVEPVEFVLKRGKATGPAMWAWHEAVQTGNMAAARKSASLVMYGHDGKPVARYHLENAWPSKIDLGSWSKAEGLDVTWEMVEYRMESVTIVFENIQRVAQ